MDIHSDQSNHPPRNPDREVTEMTCDTAKLVLGLLLAFDVCSYHTCSRPASAPLIQGVCDKIAALRAKIIAKKLEMSDPWNPCASKRAHFTDVLAVISSLCFKS